MPSARSAGAPCWPQAPPSQSVVKRTCRERLRWMRWRELPVPATCRRASRSPRLNTEHVVVADLSWRVPRWSPAVARLQRLDHHGGILAQLARSRRARCRSPRARSRRRRLEVGKLSARAAVAPRRSRHRDGAVPAAPASARSARSAYPRSSGEVGRLTCRSPDGREIGRVRHCRPTARQRTGENQALLLRRETHNRARAASLLTKKSTRSCGSLSPPGSVSGARYPRPSARAADVTLRSNRCDSEPAGLAGERALTRGSPRRLVDQAGRALASLTGGDKRAVGRAACARRSEQASAR